MTAPVTDNSFQPLPSIEALRTLPSLRVTQIAKLIECPRQWKAIMLGEGEQFHSPAARIGTVVHLVIERFLRGEFSVLTGWEEQERLLTAMGVPAPEQRALVGYLGGLDRYRGTVLDLEREFVLRLTPPAPAVKGHIDAVFLPEGGPLIIRDHKTNRQFQDVEWWRQQWQPRLYAWAARALWSGRTPIVFQIGYVNLGEVVQWEPDPLDWFALAAQYAHAWQEVQRMLDADQWREQVNEHCCWCPVRKTCAASRAATQALYGALGRQLWKEERSCR